MIKVIAVDFVGVLVREVEDLIGIEDQLERLFGPNKSDDVFNKIEEYLK